MQLDLSSLANAIAQLEEALEFAHSDLAKNDARLALHLRAGAIQAFEFTYELSFKMLRRFLEHSEANPAASEEMTFNELIRRGYALGLLHEELAVWKEFRQDRGTTSHTYQQQKAEEVFNRIPRFLAEAQFVLAQIQQRQQADS